MPAAARSAAMPNAACPYAIRDYAARQDLELATFAGPEAQAAAIADDIAYDAHDIDDGLRAGLLTLEGLAGDGAGRRHPRRHRRGLSRPGAGARDPGTDPPPDLDHDRRRRRGEPRAARRRSQPTSADAIRAAGAPDRSPSRRPWPQRRQRDQGDAQGQRLSPPPGDGRDGQDGERCSPASSPATSTIPAAMPEAWRPPSGHDDSGARARRVADFLAGMTDRYALGEYSGCSARRPDLGSDAMSARRRV